MDRSNKTRQHWGYFATGLLSLLFQSLAGTQVIAQVVRFPDVHNSLSEQHLSPMPAEEAARQMRLPVGFQATVYAAEPDVQNPIGLSWDKSGRLWIAENYTYSDRTQRFDLTMNDRVLVFRDVDGDGRADSRQVFIDNVQMLTSVEVGRGGVWLMCPPRLLFVPDANEDAVADSAPRTVLDGFHVAQDNYHNFANGLKFGPDCWLYGRCGHSCPGNVGIPGTPDALRVPLDGGIWRYHPDKRIFEVLCHGTTNPWGHDWDEHGELFFINTVIGHLWHMLPGSHFKESFGESNNPLVYERMDMIADHYHFDRGGGWQASRDGKSNDVGGGHAHIGMAIYQGDAWPDEYKGKLLTLNMHGRRANVERLDRVGSGYVGRHEPDWLVSVDPFFRGIDLSFGPDGNCYVIDWSDTGECHEHSGVHRTSGRIFRISYETNGDLSPQFAKPSCLAGPGDLPRLWSRFQENELPRSEMVRLLSHPDEHVRVWAIRFLTDLWPLDWMTGQRPPGDGLQSKDEIAALVALAATDDSGLVRRQLASTLQRLPLVNRFALAKELVQRDGDADDLELNLLVWYGVSPLGLRDSARLVELFSVARWPKLAESIVRCIASQSKETTEHLNEILESAVNASTDVQQSVLVGLQAAYRGWHRAVEPPAWDALKKNLAQHSESASAVRQLDVLFGDGRAIEEVAKVVLDGREDMQNRVVALRTLISASPDNLRPICESLLDVRVLNVVAAKGLAQFDDPRIAKLLIQKYRRFQSEDRPALLEILVSRPSFANALLDDMRREAPTIARTELQAVQARQIRQLGQTDLTAKLEQVWGTVNDSSAEKSAEIENWNAQLQPQYLSQANLRAGRRLFDASCAQCHKLFGNGKQIGPDLTGAQRSSLDYLLGNILDPSAVVGTEYRNTTLLTADGRTLSGLVLSQDENRVVLRTTTDEIALSRDDIEFTREATTSIMPDGLLQNLTTDQVRDLMGYLMSPFQVEAD